MKNHIRHRQRGATLLVALIMLVLLTMLVLTSVNLGKGTIQAVGNMQQRNEAYSAAKTTVEQVISDTRFFETPTNVISDRCNGQANTKCIDTNGDGVADVTVKLTPPPACVKVQGIKNTNLDMSLSEDVGCAVGQQQSFGVAGSTTGNSMCSNSVWEINADATDLVTQAKVDIIQGVAVRVSNDAIATSCP